MRYQCLACEYIYDESKGDDTTGIESGTTFDDLPEDWLCPECGFGKDQFENQRITMEVFRCRICGEAYMGTEKPSNCPYCGVNETFLVPGKDWKDENIGVELSEISKRNLEETLKLETLASIFYKNISKESKNPEISALFKTLSKVEKEHNDVAMKLLGIEKSPYEDTKDPALDTDEANLEESKKREQHAVSLYVQFKEEAREPRLKTFFGALIVVEKDHVIKDEEELANLT